MYSKIELRRFRGYETTLVVAYTRPFSQSRGAVPPLKMVDLKLSKERQALHDRLMEMRNKIMAHSDSEMMRMTTQPFDVPMRDGEPPDRGEPPPARNLRPEAPAERAICTAVVRTLRSGEQDQCLGIREAPGFKAV